MFYLKLEFSRDSTVAACNIVFCPAFYRLLPGLFALFITLCTNVQLYLLDSVTTSFMRFIIVLLLVSLPVCYAITSNYLLSYFFTSPSNREYTFDSRKFENSFLRRISRSWNLIEFSYTTRWLNFFQTYYSKFRGIFLKNNRGSVFLLNTILGVSPMKINSCERIGNNSRKIYS